MFVNLRVVDGVALRKESVDRNAPALLRRVIDDVALRKESVDRNCRKAIIAACACRRSPQGERG